jgi:predicted acetyltransferase
LQWDKGRMISPILSRTSVDSPTAPEHMHREGTDPIRVEVLPATLEQQPVLANLLELYSHDFSEVIDLQLQPSGRFGYPRLPLYWQEETRHPFLIMVDGQIAGFALLSKGSQVDQDPEVWDMAEFFVVRGYRKRGVGRLAAHEIWRRFPGSWEVRVRTGNESAESFWKAVIDRLPGADLTEEVVQGPGKQWRVFSFTLPPSVRP